MPIPAVRIRPGAAYGPFAAGGRRYLLLDRTPLPPGMRWPRLRGKAAEHALERAFRDDAQLPHQIRRRFPAATADSAFTPLSPDYAARRLAKDIAGGALRLFDLGPWQPPAAPWRAAAASAPPLRPAEPDVLQRMQRIVAGLADVPPARYGGTAARSFAQLAEALRNPWFIGALAGGLAAWFAAHFFGVGFLADAVIFGLVVAAIGLSAFAWAGKVGAFLVAAKDARTHAEFRRCSELLADIIVEVGVDVFIALLLRGAGRAAGTAAGEAQAARRVAAGPRPAPIPGRGAAAPRARLDAAAVKAMPKGSRPDPKTYMSADEIAAHGKAFEGGGSRFMLESNLKKYGPGREDGTSFIMTKAEADALLKRTGGDLSKLEDALGLPPGQLANDKLVRVDFPDPKSLGVRIPSGNEAGANSLWLPGGKLPDGSLEAVIDIKALKPGDMIVKAIGP